MAPPANAVEQADLAIIEIGTNRTIADRAGIAEAGRTAEGQFGHAAAVSSRRVIAKGGIGLDCGVSRRSGRTAGRGRLDGCEKI
jgi:hypothetical protein